MDLGLKGKTAVVLGSTSGLGLAVARALLAEGAHVALSGRDTARLERAESELAAPRGALLAEVLDVRDRAAVERHVARATERLGPVGVLVTNSGGPPHASALEVDDAGLDAAFELLVRSAIHAVQAVLPGMRARRWGRIVGLTSLAVRQPIPNLAYSNVMRSGLTAYFKSLASEVARDGVLVNTICTGYFDTERLTELFAANAAKRSTTPAAERAAAEARIPAGRLGAPRELGELVAFLCSERASYVTGVALPLDGGLNPALL
jgi:3-oxoacyl-[acyl-carrier protein] reductase